MRGVNLNVFDFDYDHEWAAMFLGDDDTVYGRFSGSRGGTDDKYLNLDALSYAMQRALDRHGKTRGTNGKQQADRRPPGALQLVEQYPAAKRLKADACIHCHQVYDFRREQREAAGLFRKLEVWVYPQPDNVGLTLDPRQGNRVQSVTTESPAAKIGLRPGDILTTVHGVPTASFADVQYGLHRAPAMGEAAIAWQRDGKAMTAAMSLSEGWRRTDLSWRASTRRLGPDPSVHGEDLTAEERKALGLTDRQLALRQGNFVTAAARQAGIRQNDVIIGIGGELLEITGGQFLVHIRLSYRPGDQVTFTLLRDGKRLDVPMTLPRR